MLEQEIWYRTDTDAGAVVDVGPRYSEDSRRIGQIWEGRVYRDYGEELSYRFLYQQRIYRSVLDDEEDRIVAVPSIVVLQEEKGKLGLL